MTPVARGPVEALLVSLNLGPQQGLDPEPENIVAVGTFTSTPPGQPPQQVSTANAVVLQHFADPCAALMHPCRQPAWQKRFLLLDMLHECLPGHACHLDTASRLGSCCLRAPVAFSQCHEACHWLFQP